MSRPWVLTVKDNPKLEPAKLYLVEIEDIQPAGNTIKATLRHRSPPQEGRQQEVLLSAELFPMSLAASLFRACGFDTSVGASIRPRDARGKLVKVVFRPSNDGGVEVDRIEYIHSEVTHEPDTQPTDAPVGPSGFSVGRLRSRTGT